MKSENIFYCYITIFKFYNIKLVYVLFLTGSKKGELDDINEEGSVFHDSEYEISDDDELFEINVDEDIERGMSKSKEEGRNSLLIASRNNEVHSDYGESDEFESVEDYTGDDGESNHRRFPELRTETDMDNPNFALGMLFSNKGEFRDVVKEFGIRNRVNIKFYKNDKQRMGAR